MRTILSVGIATAFLALCSLPGQTRENFGHYDGVVQAEWLDDGRKMRLLADFVYIDPNEIKWSAPEGSIVDGASIPRIFWTIFGSPFTGKYRDASVIHDVACVERNRTWELVHLAFYYGMRASDVEESHAQRAYAAVYHLGPRWKLMLDRTQETVAKVEMNEFCLAGACSDIDSGSDVVMSMDTITISPPEAYLSEHQVKELMQQIEARWHSGDPFSLDEIRNYGR